MPRMRILNTVERYDFDFPPTFNSLQRKKYFYFSDTLYHMVSGLRSPAHQVGFLISCGYFLATKNFLQLTSLERLMLNMLPKNWDCQMYWLICMNTMIVLVRNINRPYSSITVIKLLAAKPKHF